MALASSSVSGARSLPEATPPTPRACPGMTVRSVVPSDAMRSFTDCCAPRPSATMAITAPTPITIPSMVRNERSLFERSDSSATLTVSSSCILGPATATPSSAGAAAPTPGAGNARHSASHPLTDAALRLCPGRLRFRHAQEHDLFAELHPIDHLRVIEVAEPEAHDPRLEPPLGLHERDLRAARPSLRAAAHTAASTRAGPASRPAGSAASARGIR